MGRRALVLEHVGHEQAAGFCPVLRAAGYDIATAHVPDGLPDICTADLLVVMGGPMGVYERAAHPWLTGEIAAVAARIAAAAPTLGICLGSQIIAAALGGPVHPGAVKEVGFAPVTLSDEGRASPLHALTDVPLLHWHGDTFDLPEGVERLASSTLYPNQAFRRGDQLLALQCHPEMGDPDDGFGAWLDGSAAYIAAAGLTPDQLALDHARLGPAAAEAGRRMLTAWLARLPI